MTEIDWSAIASRIPKSADTRIQCSNLADKDYWLLRAAAKAKKRSVASDCASLLSASIRRLEGEWLELIAFQAEMEGLSFEEMFVKLATGED